ncbi:MAG TPA: hypothetical protein VM689_15970 [Aliidongia sp.]|nr:hypothetical protein [Aliidongia sp.]
MRHSLLYCLCSLAASSCSTGVTNSPGLPAEVGGGRGSQFGNYATVVAGETVIGGERCILYNWDRPLPDGRVLRYRSASCFLPNGRARAIGLDSSIVPMTESELRFEAPVEPDDPTPNRP